MCNMDLDPSDYIEQMRTKDQKIRDHEKFIDELIKEKETYKKALESIQANPSNQAHAIARISLDHGNLIAYS